MIRYRPVEMKKILRGVGGGGGGGVIKKYCPAWLPNQEDCSID